MLPQGPSEALSRRLQAYITPSSGSTAACPCYNHHSGWRALQGCSRWECLSLGGSSNPGIWTEPAQPTLPRSASSSRATHSTSPSLVRVCSHTGASPARGRARFETGRFSVWPLAWLQQHIKRDTSECMAPSGYEGELESIQASTFQPRLPNAP